MSGDTALRVQCPLRPPCAPISLRQIASSNAQCAQHYPATPFGLFCGAILLCDMGRTAARALFPAGTEVLFRRVPLPRQLAEPHKKCLPTCLQIANRRVGFLIPTRELVLQHPLRSCTKTRCQSRSGFFYSHLRMDDCKQ